MTEYNKLVRDRIPEMIRRAGDTPVVRTLEQEEYLVCLQKKLDEETAEYKQSGELEELVDILEVVFALAEAHGHTRDELMTAYQTKHDARGGYRSRVFLIRKE